MPNMEQRLLDLEDGVLALKGILSLHQQIETAKEKVRVLELDLRDARDQVKNLEYSKRVREAEAIQGQGHLFDT